MFFRVISKPQTLLAVSAISFERKTVATGLGSLQPCFVPLPFSGAVGEANDAGAV